MEDNKAQWLSIGQASKYLGVSRDTLRRWEKAGKIKAVRSPTDRRYYTKKQLDEAMERKSAPATPSSHSNKPSRLKIEGRNLLITVGVAGFLAAAALVTLAQLFWR